MGDGHSEKISRAYRRALEKNETQSAIEEEYFDPQIPCEHAAGGDPGVVQIMAEAADRVRRRA